jgi:hypothetical protein
MGYFHIHSGKERRKVPTLFKNSQIKITLREKYQTQRGSIQDQTNTAKAASTK